MIITRKHIKENPKTLFIFGDNDQRYGLGGMAKEFRGEANTVGIRTKKKPSMSAGSFYVDSEYTQNIKKIDKDLNLVLHKFMFGGFTKIYVPEGIGEGLAKLDCAPKTLKYLKDTLKKLREDYQ